jgi:hypothetical protein
MIEELYKALSENTEELKVERRATRIEELLHARTEILMSIVVRQQELLNQVLNERKAA